ncbi:hypothetical protein J2128_000536 [Methanomicrobium sp. W14]|uniref:hypothetical protein n=1 Tax=Methanomicrobium sp. W14 TaxID=2817839 RepID=UPI001AE60ACB|nr:hypothetical protein [Methanomicrobium sp. W14]MBP2132615.1 hypothetical protein [Methanomicrobium sp. W14]
MARKPREEDYTKISVRVANKSLNIIDELAVENERDRSGEINVALKFYTRFASQAQKKGMSVDELQGWLFKEVIDLSEKYDQLEDLVNKMKSEKE